MKSLATKFGSLCSCLILSMFMLGCSEETLPEVVASFEMDATRISEGESIHFFDTSEGNPNSWNWNFPEGSPSNSREKNPIIAYNTPGVHNVQLIVANSHSVDTLLMTNAVAVTCEEEYCQSTYDLLPKYGVIYGNHPEAHYMELYEPDIPDPEPRPMVIFFGGGNYRSYSGLHLLEPLAQMVAKYGYITASARYTVRDWEVGDDFGCRLVETQQDTKAAVRYFRSNAEQYNIDPDLIFIGGNSSGATISLYHAYNDSLDLINDADQLNLYARCGGFEGNKGTPGVSSEVAGVIALSGEMYGRINSINMEDQNTPLFGICSATDMVDPCTITELGGIFTYGLCPIVERAQNVGIKAELYMFPSGDHTTPRLAITSYEDELISFLRQCIAEKKN